MSKSKKSYEVIVGNVGTVYRGGNKKTANEAYSTYYKLSQGQLSRAAGESVVLMCDDEIIREHEGRVNE